MGGFQAELLNYYSAFQIDEPHFHNQNSVEEIS